MTAVIFVHSSGASDPREREAAQDAPAAAGGVAPHAVARSVEGRSRLVYQPRRRIDTGGFLDIVDHLRRWRPDASLAEIRDVWAAAGPRTLEDLDRALPPPGKSDSQRLQILLSKVSVYNYEGQTDRAYELLAETRAWTEKSGPLAELGLYTLIYFQGVTALRRGETDNCVMCRGESSCILPIVPAAVHTNPAGSRLAIHHFTEYLRQFPDDLDVRWLLNLAHMTLGEHPAKVDPRFLISLDHYLKSEFDIGKFRDIGDKAGVNRFNMAGGAIMDDFDNDGRLDLAVTAFDPAASLSSMAFYHNAGDGSFEDRTKKAGLTQQLGGKYLTQTDFNNDGRLDLFISRGAWFHFFAMPQTLLRNNGDGTFSDASQQSGLGLSVNSTSSRWADYDNDGWLDVFIVCEAQSNRLYRNRGDGTLSKNVTEHAAVQQDGVLFCKGADWIDYDNDDYPDLFVNNMRGDARLYHNNRNGTFTDVTQSMGIKLDHVLGFSCWAWDYDNDGWLDIFATCFDYTTADVVKGLLGQPHDRLSNRLFRNLGGKGFEDKTKEAGLDLVFAAMGSNFGDFDNDGFLDFYLGTGDPDLSTLVPNRMFKNVAGKRFAEITASAGTGNLQKGHGVSCADWDRDGDVDLFIEMGGAIPGDRYHNILFQNPGQKNHWLTVKLIGKKTNRAAIGNPAYQGRHVRRSSPHGLPARFLRAAVGVPTLFRAAYRSGQGRPSRHGRGPLAGERDDPDLSRHRDRPGHRSDRARRQFSCCRSRWKPIPAPK